MKRLISIFATIAMLSTMFVVPTSVSAATAITPNTDGVYEIRTADELKWVSEQVNADTEKNGMSTASYKLMNDINLEGAEWIPIGKQSVPFNGTFDGNGYRVSNLQITTPYGITDAETLCITDNGFFGYTGANANVSKLGISKITVEIYVHNSNNTTEGNGSGRARHMAGMVGYLQGTWTDCYVVDSTIRNTKTDCNESGNTAGFAAYIGANATVSNCYVRNVGLRSAQEKIMGGFFGEAAANINKIENCYTAGVYIYRTGTSHSAVTSDAALYAFGGSTADVSKFVNCYAEQGNSYDGGGKGVSTETVDNNTRGTLNQSKSAILDAFITENSAYTEDEDGYNDAYPILKSQKVPEGLVNKIYTAQDLINAAAAINADTEKTGKSIESYRLMNDIDLDGIEWTPIGKLSVPFNGTFDGNGYRVSNFKVTTPYGDNEATTLCIADNGFFGYTGTNARVKDLGINRIKVAVYVHNSNNTTEGHTSGRARYLAGMVGYAQGTWTNCYVVNSTIQNTRTDLNESAVAGFAAYVGENATISDCYVQNVGVRSAQETKMAGFFGDSAAAIK